MKKYLRIVFLAGFEFTFTYLFIILPNVIFRKRWSLKHRYTTLRGAVRRLHKYLRLKLHVTNLQRLDTKEKFFIVCNHHSMIDPFLVIHLIKDPVRFLAKKEVRHQLVFGDASASIDALFIDRKSIKSQIAVLRTMKESLIQKDSHWLVFPEGTRNKQKSQPLLPFKAGTFKQAMETNSTILPMVTYGFFRPLNPKINWKSYPIQVDFLAPITPEMYEGKTSFQLAEDVQHLMQFKTDEMVELDQTLRGSNHD
jgi:1-acyl-sn-glycerol-3-phosphate acyltransferase